MCSFPIRETRISRVVFAMRSPVMGGLSKWNVLRDTQLSQVMPEVFGPVPEVVAGLSQHDAEKVWAAWHPLIWRIIRYRGCFGHETDGGDAEHLAAIPGRRSWLRRLLTLHHNRHSA
jgi:tRNA(adenine34) deaminase